MLETYDGWLPDEGPQGMDTLSIQGILTHDDPIPTESANTYTEVGQFVGQTFGQYTDLRKPLCGCD